MDSRLQRVGGERLVPLRYSDAPRVARAIIDAINGDAKVHTGISRDTAYVEIVREGSYLLIVRGDDWRKIFPFFRYSTKAYRPVVPPPNQPAPIMSPQPNRVMEQPPVSPTDSLCSFLEGFSFDTYSKIQNLLTVLSDDDLDRQVPPFRRTRIYPEATPWLPPEQRTDTSDFYNTMLYNKLVPILQKLFPVDFPTTY